MPTPWPLSLRTNCQMTVILSTLPGSQVLTESLFSMPCMAAVTTRCQSREGTDSAPDRRKNHSSSLDSSSSSSVAFFAGFFFFFLFFPLAPVDLAVGCSRIFRICSSVIFLSVLYFETSNAGGAARRTRPFLVIAGKRRQPLFDKHR